jgi:hypothetical protein
MNLSMRHKRSVNIVSVYRSGLNYSDNDRDLDLRVKTSLLADRHHESASHRGSALERTVFEAPPRVRSISSVNRVVRPLAEPAKHWVY